MGADEFIAAEEDAEWAKKNSRTLNLIVSTVSGADLPMSNYLQLLRAHGQFIQDGAPEEAIPRFNAFALLMKGAKIRRSSIGTPKKIREMLAFAAEKGLHPRI